MIVADGYAVIPVMSEQRAKQYLEELKLWLAEKELDLAPRYAGIIVAKSIGHSPFMKRVRKLKKVKEVFRKLYKCETKDLARSFDGAGLIDKGVTIDMWPHRDVRLDEKKKKLRKCWKWQSFVQLTTNNDTEGFVCWPGSHLKMATLMPQDARVEDAVCVTVPAGSMVIWDTRLIHCNWSRGVRERASLYVCMTPQKTLSKVELDNLVEFAKKKITTTHDGRYRKQN